MGKTKWISFVVLIFMLLFSASAFGAWREQVDITNLNTNQIQPIDPATTMTIGGSGDTVTINGLSAALTRNVALPVGSFVYYDTSLNTRETHNDLNILSYKNISWHVWSNGAVTPLEATFPVPPDFSSTAGVFKVLLYDSQQTSLTKPSIAFLAYRSADGVMPTGGSSQTAVAVAASPDEATCTVLTDVTPVEAGGWITFRIWPSWGSAVGDLYFGGAEWEYTGSQ